MSLDAKVSAACLLCVALAAAAPAAPPDAAALDSVLTEALKTWRVPGLAVAVVRDDEVVYLKGAGVREAGGTDAVTPDTVFGIGPCTEGFTATAVAQIVEDGKADWDDLVRKHIPSFRLSDPLADRDATLRDLLCHRTGLGKHPLLAHDSAFGPEETVKRLAFLEPDHSFRGTFEPTDVGYIAAGVAVSAAAKSPWHEFVRKRLFEPLGMGGAVFTRADALKAADHASPHRRNAADKVEIVPKYNDDKQVVASKSIKASARDLSKWLRLQLNAGLFDGKRLVSAAALAETHTPQIVMPLDAELAKAAGTTQWSYGLGWRIGDYRGKSLWDQGGAADGFAACILLASKEKVGVVVLANLDDAEIVDAVSYNLLDAVLGLQKKDWNVFFAARLKDAEAARQARADKRAASRKPGTKPSREPAAYAGTYEDAAYGTVRITADDGLLTLEWGRFRKPLKHFHYDAYLIDEPDVRDAGPLAGELAVFHLGSDGEVESLRFLGRKFKRFAR